MSEYYRDLETNCEHWVMRNGRGMLVARVSRGCDAVDDKESLIHRIFRFLRGGAK